MPLSDKAKLLRGAIARFLTTKPNRDAMSGVLQFLDEYVGESGGGGGGGLVYWLPGGAGALGSVETFPEVVAALALLPPGSSVLCDGTLGALVVPDADAPYELSGAILVQAVADQNGTIVSLDDGATLSNLGGVSGRLELQANNTAPGALVFDADRIVSFTNGAILTAQGSAPVVTLSNASLELIAVGASIGSSGGSPPAIFELETGALTVRAYQGTALNEGWITGDGASSLTYYMDLSVLPSDPDTFGGTVDVTTATDGIFFSPGSTPAGACATWAQVMALVDALPAGQRITCNTSASSPGGEVLPAGTWAMKSAVLAGFRTSTGADQAHLVLPDGCALSGLAGIDAGLILESTNTAGNSVRLNFSGGNPIFVVDNLARLVSSVTGQNMIQLLASQTAVLIVRNQGALVGSGLGTAPVVGVANAATLVLNVYTSATLYNNCISGPAGSGLTIQIDDTVDFPTFSSALTVVQSPLTGAACITADRPAGTRRPGFMIFDTTIGKPIWWSGAAWVLADGTPA